MLVATRHTPQRVAWNFASRLHGGVYVHSGHTTELGQLVSCGGFLRALREKRRQRSALRERIAAGRHFPGGCGGVVSIQLQSVTEATKLCWSLGRAPASLFAALVLVAGECLE